jgi:hypothetical protein
VLSFIIIISIYRLFLDTITRQRTAHLLHARGGLGFFTEQLLEQHIHARPGQMAATQCLLYGL